MAQHRDVHSHGNAIQPKTVIGKSGTRQYHRLTPQFWSDVMPTSQTLHPTIVSLSCNDASVCSLAPMLILTRRPLPELEGYNSFLKGIPVTTQLRNVAPVILDAEQLQLLGQYTVRLCRIVMNKPFVSTLDNMLFFFAPIDPMAPDETGRTPSTVTQISWEMVTRFVMTWSIPINAETPECIEQDIHDAIIQDRRTEFTRRFEVIKLRRDLTPFSRIADQCKGESASSSLLDVIKSKSQYQSFVEIQYHDQPIIEASVVECHANYLSPVIPPPTKPGIKYLIPELCNKLNISASTLRTALILPSVFHRIDHLLLVKELNANVFKNVISDSLLSIAATCISACMEFDYERHELLGDAFLKYLSSIYIAETNMPKTEHAMHEARQRMVNNRTLTQIALQTGLPTYIQSRPFVSKHWKPFYFEILPSSNQLLVNDVSALTEYHQANQKETGSQDQIHWLADKTIADVTEAIIGSAYLSGGDELGFNVAKMLGLAMPLVDQWQNLQDKISVACSDTAARPSCSQGSSASLGLVSLKFRRPELLSQALSRQNTVICSTLAFVGDAILEFLIVKYVFEREPRLSSGGLSLLKAAMMSNATLATIFVSSKLSNGLSYGPREMSSLNSFANRIEILRNEEYKQAETEKRSPGQFWRAVEPPKMLVTLLKSIIGALYMSNAPSHVELESLFKNEFKLFYDKHITIKTLANRPIVAFVELLRAHGCYQFDIKKEDMNQATRCQVTVHDHVLATVEDQTASYAVMSACRSALGTLEANAMMLRVYCNCKAQPQKRKKDDFFNRLLVLEEQ